MATTPVTHRCFACPLPQHATFWTTDPATTVDELVDLLARNGHTITSLRRADPHERVRYLGTEIPENRVVWIALQPTSPEPLHQ